MFNVDHDISACPHFAVNAIIAEEMTEQRIVNLHANVQRTIRFLPFADEWPTH
jgi:hypothetical protein